MLVQVMKRNQNFEGKNRCNKERFWEWCFGAILSCWVRIYESFKAAEKIENLGTFGD